jgi:hydroxymethylpyrimidine pyrophosphatase-like HAD family hydrolase
VEVNTVTFVEKTDLKMLVLDLDGTILNDKQEIIPENLNAVKELKKKNPETLICIATGRTFRTSIQFARQIGVDLLITHDGKAIYSKINDKKYKLEKVFNMSEQENPTPLNKIKKPLMRRLCNLKTPMIKLWSKLSILKYQIKSGFSFHKIKKHHKFNRYLEKSKDKISYLSPFPTMKAIAHSDANKGNAVIYIMEKLKQRGIHINRSEVAIVGNDYNDLNMLKLDGFQSYCPSNAIKQIKNLTNVSPLKGTNNEAWINELLEDFEMPKKQIYKAQANYGITSRTFLEKFLAKAKKNFPNHTQNTALSRQNINKSEINKSPLDIAR